MPTHVALLRGINVGGHRRVPMPELRALAAELGHTDVATYIQSGNLVFTPAPGSGDPAAGLAAAIEERFGFPVPVVVVSAAELAAVIADCPVEVPQEGKQLHAVFLTGDPAPAQVERVEAEVRRAAERGSRDTAVLQGRVIYLLTPDGIGTSDLAQRLVTTKGKGPVGTARNWLTVAALAGMCRP